MESLPSSGSLKRSKAPGNITQVANCLVDGCDSDLSLGRDYHRRHKVCEIHSKTPKVIIGGREQRFCQQCSRFHSLVEFDEAKRSCRKRLDGHNRRRRKPQPDSIAINPGLVFSGQPVAVGPRFLSFSSPPPNAVESSSGAGVVKSESNMFLYSNQQQHMNYIEKQNSFSQWSPHGVYHNQFQFIQGSDSSILDSNAETGTSNSSRNVFSDGCDRVVDCDRAPSLLSSAPPVSRVFDSNHTVHPEQFPQVQSLLHNFNYGGLSHPYPFTEETKQVVSATGSHGSDPSTSHYQEKLHQSHDRSSNSVPHQTLTFMWE